MAITVPPGQSPPFETINSQHHAGIIIITSAICMVITLVCLLIRIYVRLLISPPLAFDDLILLGATTTAIVESVIVFYNSHIGFGTAITLLGDQTIARIQNRVAATDVLYLFTLYLSRCCIIAIYSRLTPRRRHKNTLWVTFAISTAVILISILILTVDCSVNKPWVPPGEHCVNLFARWQFITAFDIITELCLFIFSIALVWDLQMPFKHKMIIMISFAARLPLIPISALRLTALHTFVSSKNPTFDAIRPYVWTQVELNYSLISCTVFCLRPFMNAVTTAYGTAGDENLETSARSQSHTYGSNSRSRSGTNAYGSGNHSQSRSRRHRRSLGDNYALQSFGKGGLATMDEGHQPSPFLPKDAPCSGAMVQGSSSGGHSDRDERGSVGSDGSTRMIIKKDVEYTVHREPREGSL